MNSFKSIRFGLSSAEAEKAEFPELLIKGFWDGRGLLKQALEDRHYLFLGYKGSGKSCLGEKLGTLSGPTLFVTNARLADFPYKTFKSIVAGSAEPQAKYPVAWSWLLLLQLIRSFAADQGAASSNSPEFIEAVKVLQKMGLLPNTTLQQMVMISAKNGFKVQIPELLEVFTEEEYEGADLQFSHLVEHLESLALRFQTDSPHLLVIDGVDDVLTGSDTRFESLGALVFEVGRLNQKLRAAGVKAKVIVLCRTELFEKLPNPNKNKARQDYAVYLDWYDNTRDPRESELIKLCNARAGLSLGRSVDIFKTYFPEKVSDAETITFLLRHTRHTPRDFIQALAFIQKFSSNKVLDKEQILNGLREYSINYFMPEIRDELDGYFSGEDIDRCMKVLGAVRKREFTFAELLTAASAVPKATELPLEKLMDALFECSAVGNIDNRPGGTTYFSFRFRNRHASLSLNDRIVIHAGLWKALNLI